MREELGLAADRNLLNALTDMVVPDEAVDNAMQRLGTELNRSTFKFSFRSAVSAMIAGRLEVGGNVSFAIQVDQSAMSRIRIASNSEQHINPMDVTIDDYLMSNPMEVIADKSDFLISLCEIIVGGRYGLTAEERSVIDKCVQRIYKNFIENQPSVEKMPLLSDLQHELKERERRETRYIPNGMKYANGGGI